MTTNSTNCGRRSRRTIGLIFRVVSGSLLLSSSLPGAAAFHDDLATLVHHPNHQARLLQSVLSDGPQDLPSVCDAVQKSFINANVSCDCYGTPETFLSIQCKYKTEICSASTCGRPQLGVSFVDGKIFSSTTCMKNYTRNNDKVLGETCVAVTACPNPDDGLCDCIASYSSDICQKCEVCSSGKGIAFDCTNVNAEAITSACSQIDMDLDLNGAGPLGGFVPEMSGLCTNLEQTLENRVSCDCSQAVGGDFTITCETTASQNVTSDTTATTTTTPSVKSTVKVVQGAVNSVTACSGPSCTAVQFCAGGTEQVCACLATYEDQPCKRCWVCDGGQSVQLDCSNIKPNAVTDECQTVQPTFEFVPQFSNRTATVTDPADGSNANPTTTNTEGTVAANTSSGVRVGPIYALAGTLVVSASLLFVSG